MTLHLSRKKPEVEQLFPDHRFLPCGVCDAVVGVCKYHTNTGKKLFGNNCTVTYKIDKSQFHTSFNYSPFIPCLTSRFCLLSLFVLNTE